MLRTLSYVLTALFILIFSAMVAERFNGDIPAAHRKTSGTPQISKSQKILPNINVLESGGKNEGRATLQGSLADRSVKVKPQHRGASAVQMPPNRDVDFLKIDASNVPKAELPTRVVPSSVADAKDQTAARPGGARTVELAANQLPKSTIATRAPSNTTTSGEHAATAQYSTATQSRSGTVLIVPRQLIPRQRTRLKRSDQNSRPVLQTTSITNKRLPVQTASKALAKIQRPAMKLKAPVVTTWVAMARAGFTSSRIPKR